MATGIQEGRLVVINLRCVAPVQNPLIGPWSGFHWDGKIDPAIRRWNIVVKDRGCMTTVGIWPPISLWYCLGMVGDLSASYVRDRVLSDRTHSIEETLNLNGWRWFEHPLRTPADQPLRCAVFLEACNGWKAGVNDYCMTWWTGTETLANNLFRVRLIWFPHFGPRDS